jgi:hypothetical protein
LTTVLRQTRLAAITRLAIALLAVAVLAVACGGGDDAKTTTTKKRATTTTAGPIAPLTGLAGPGADRPALIVKIDNAPKGRPQAGINAADIVIEELVEGGITRLAVIFHSSDADPVGPVRSARSTDIAIASSLNRPLFAYSGANAVFLELVHAAPLVDVGVGVQKDSYRREPGRPSLYNLFTTTAQLFARAAEGGGPPPPMFAYRAAGEKVAAGAEASTGVAMEYRDKVRTAVEWTWHAESKTWRRVQNGTPHVDAAGEQVAPQNVVVQFVDYRDTGFVDQSGTAVPEAELIGEGEAWVFTAGKVVRGRWSKPDATTPTAFVDAAGEPVKLTPGRTWIELPKPGTARTL